jgi:hypothetical protein
MPKRDLSKQVNYEITSTDSVVTENGLQTTLNISIKKLRPSKRLTIHLEPSFKVTACKAIRLQKGVETELVFHRQYHHKKLEEFRLYSEETLYPGQYSLMITYLSSSKTS